MNRIFSVLLIFSVLAGLSSPLVFSYPTAHAAVPVVVEDFGIVARDYLQTLIDQLLEALGSQGDVDADFLFNLHTKLQEREFDFLTTFELQKIEKAREDVNKLIFATESELKDTGFLYDTEDPRLGLTPLIGYKDGRIIRNLSDYFFEEPIKMGRIYVMCYMNLLIWDQAGVFTGTQKRTFGPSTSASINSLDVVRRSQLVTISRDKQFIVNEPGIMSVFGWPTAGNPQGPEGDAATNKENCLKAISAMAGRLPSGVTGQEDEIAQFFNPDALNTMLPKIERGIAWNDELGDNGWKWGDFLRTAKGDTETINSVASSVWVGAQKIIGEMQKLNTAQYIAGQGIRPEKVFLQLPNPRGATPDYYLETQYVASPAAILLQKMQSATQSQFDLARQAYLNLNNADLNDPAVLNLINAYNLRVATSTDLTITNKDGSFEKDLEPWLKPKPPQFVSAVDKNKVNPSEGGLPAPWEDAGKYAELGNYRLHDFLLPPEPTGEIEANIGSTGESKEASGYRPAILRDYYLNEWFVHVLDMYTSHYARDCDTAGINLIGFGCIVEIWFLPELFFVPAT